MKNILPIFVTRDTVVFPKQKIQIEVGREVSIKAIENAIENDGKILITSQKDIEKGVTKTNIFNFGVVAKVKSFEDKPNSPGIKILTTKSLDRVNLKNIFKENEIFYSEFEIATELNSTSETNIELLGDLNKLILEDEIIKIKETDRQNLEETLSSSSLSQYIDFLASIIPMEYSVKISILKENDITKRIQILNDILNVKKQNIENRLKSNPYNSNETQNEINEKVKSKLSKQQREFYLREQLKIIKDELDEISGEENEFETLRRRINDNPFPEHIKVKLLSELKRLEAMPSINAESNVIKNYIDWVIELPYWTKDEEIIDIKHAKEVLDSKHFGLEKPKNRILEFLAQKQKNPNAKPTIICFVGPPGTGKTSLSKSIAESLNRKFAKISLGGVKDESEIRGHRKTYIASAPGKIIQAMKKVGVINPVILLDEIDKMSSDYKGDPASAMLEVLDYEQNTHFQDHFIEEDYDLSNVMFIATANNYSDIPSALLDRLEMIELSSYTELEKFNIVKEHLIPKVLEETKISKKYFNPSKETILFIIRSYTIEAGVRQIYRALLNIARKIIVKELNDPSYLKNFKLTTEVVKDLLGKERFEYTDRNDEPEVGIVTGLAWTSHGGDILPIEVTLFDGKGKLILTGQQRDVMKESANIALGFIRANYKEFGISDKVWVNGKEKEIFTEHDIHVHVPDGATPKDGPSAGITFTTALVSALLNKPVSQFIGMTGEITLHGKVFPIGGLREKSIAAYRSGLKTILIPKRNLKDLEDIPNEVKENLNIIPVATYNDVYDLVFNDQVLKKSLKTTKASKQSK